MTRATADATAPLLSARGVSAVVVASRFNGEIVQKLVDGAVEALVERGADEADVRVVWVGGALELPVLAKAAAGVAELVVCVGCVVKGGTDHYEHVCRAAVDGLLRVSLDTGVPVGNGVLTVATAEQAWERAGGAHGNKGAEAAVAALEARAALRAVRSMRWA